MIGQKYWYASIAQSDLIKIQIIDFGKWANYYKVREVDSQVEYEVLTNHLFSSKRTAKNFLVQLYQETIINYTRSLVNAQNCLDKIKGVFA